MSSSCALSRVAIDQRVGQPELDAERDQLLLGAIVDVPLELAALGVLGRDQSLARCPQLLDQTNVAQHRTGLRGEVAHEPLPRRVQRIVRRHLDGEGPQQRSLMTHLGGEVAGQRRRCVVRGGHREREATLRPGADARARSSRPTRSQTSALVAPVAPCSTCAMRGSTSSVEYVSDMRSENSLSTSYGRRATSVDQAIGDRAGRAAHRPEGEH